MKLTTDVIKRQSGHYDVSLITLLDVSQMKICHLTSLKLCLNLIELNLAYNELTSLTEFPSLPLLQSLNLSNNQLPSLNSLPSLPLLEKLFVAKNQIESIDYIALAVQLPKLRVFDFTGNPLNSSNAHSQNFQGEIIQPISTTKALQAFPNLLILNGEAPTLTKLFREISSTDFGEPLNLAENDDSFIAGIAIEDDYSSNEPEESDIGLTKFIHESTKNLEDLLQRSKHMLETTKPEQIFPATPYE